jgi:hypothetical protein
MANTQKLTKAAKIKLIKAAETIKAFATSTAVKDTTDSPIQSIVTLTGSYQLKNTGDSIFFNLLLHNVGVGATTNAVLHDASTDKDILIVADEKDSLVNHLIKTDKIASRKFFKLRTTLTATILSTFPANLQVSFSIQGGIEDKMYTIPKAVFKKAGDSIIMDISIFFF